MAAAPIGGRLSSSALVAAVVAVALMCCLHVQPSRSETTQSCRVLVGSFNVQVLGVSKVSKVEVVAQLVKIIRRYDALLIQEIRDSSGAAIKDLFAAVNSSSTPFDYVISDRLGRTSSKEEYAIFYRTDKLSVPRWYVYNDSARDEFEREPIVAEITGAGAYSDCFQTFSIIGIHVRPDDVAQELASLLTVYDQSVVKLGHGSALITGDMNADCSYLSNAAAKNVTLFKDTRFDVLINKSADTTVAASSCAYDRFVVAGTYLKSLIVPNSVLVYRFDTALGLDSTLAKAVSDHYPIEVALQGSPVGRLDPGNTTYSIEE